MKMRRRFIHVLFAALLAPVPYLSAQTTRPALTQLNSEMQSLYREVQTQFVRVQIPIATTQPVADHPLLKWGPRLDPSVRAKLESGQPVHVYIQQNSASTFPPTTGSIRLDEMNADANLVPITPLVLQTIECVGIILNDRGHVMMPMFVDGPSMKDRPLRVLIGQRQAVDAHFVGSDAQTNTTVIQLDQPAGKPATFADARPELGAMVLMVYPARGNVRLELWTGGREEYAVVVGMDGHVNGVVQRGHMLAPKLLKPVLTQLIDTGKVQRAKVGITVREVPADDPARRSAALGTRMAIRVQKVREDLPAAVAGILPGDVILSLAGESVDDVPNFAAAITACRGKTELRVLRNGSELKAFIDLQPE